MFDHPPSSFTPAPLLPCCVNAPLLSPWRGWAARAFDAQPAPEITRCWVWRSVWLREACPHHHRVSFSPATTTTHSSTTHSFITHMHNYHREEGKEAGSRFSSGQRHAVAAHPPLPRPPSSFSSSEGRAEERDGHTPPPLLHPPTRRCRRHRRHRSCSSGSSSSSSS